MKREPITEAEMDRIREAIGKENDADYVYVHFFLGCSTEQFITLKLSDVRAEGNDLILTAGGREFRFERSRPEHAEIISTLERRLRQFGTDLLFPGVRISRGVWLGWMPLTRYYYSKRILRPLLAKLGIPENKTPYRPRRAENGK